jgi:hypothetical protein
MVMSPDFVFGQFAVLRLLGTLKRSQLRALKHITDRHLTAQSLGDTKGRRESYCQGNPLVERVMTITDHGIRIARSCEL